VQSPLLRHHGPSKPRFSPATRSWPRQASRADMPACCPLAPRPLSPASAQERRMLQRGVARSSALFRHTDVLATVAVPVMPFHCGRVCRDAPSWTPAMRWSGKEGQVGRRACGQRSKRTELTAAHGTVRPARNARLFIGRPAFSQECWRDDNSSSAASSRTAVVAH
jgi:hypothetical protein